MVTVYRNATKPLTQFSSLIYPYLCWQGTVTSNQPTWLSTTYRVSSSVIVGLYRQAMWVVSTGEGVEVIADCTKACSSNCSNSSLSLMRLQWLFIIRPAQLKRHSHAALAGTDVFRRINRVFSCGHAAMAISIPMDRNQQLVFFVQQTVWVSVV